MQLHSRRRCTMPCTRSADVKGWTRRRIIWD